MGAYTPGLKNSPKSEETPVDCATYSPHVLLVVALLTAFTAVAPTPPLIPSFTKFLTAGNIVEGLDTAVRIPFIIAGLPYTKVPATPGETFVGTVYLHTPDASKVDGEVEVGIWHYDENHVDRNNTIKIVSLANNKWQRFQVETVVPSGAVQVALVINIKKSRAATRTQTR